MTASLLDLPQTDLLEKRVTALLAQGFARIVQPIASTTITTDNTVSNIHLYPEAPHAFYADYRPSYRKEAAEDGSKRMQSWSSSTASSDTVAGARDSFLLEMEPASDGNAYAHIAGDTGDAALPPNLATRATGVSEAQTGRDRPAAALRYGEDLEARRIPVRSRKPGLGMVVLLRGRVRSRARRHGEQAPIVEHAPGQFMAEVGQLSGRPTLVDARAVGAVEALLIDPPSLRAVVVAEAELGERIMRALILRRMGLFKPARAAR